MRTRLRKKNWKYYCKKSIARVGKSISYSIQHTETSSQDSLSNEMVGINGDGIFIMANKIGFAINIIDGYMIFDNDEGVYHDLKGRRRRKCFY
jgi:hypothetical protein